MKSIYIYALKNRAMLAGLLQGIRSFSPFPPLQQSEEVGSRGWAVLCFW